MEPFRIGNECPRSPYCWKSAVGAFRFSYEEERLGSVLWRIHPSGLDGQGACPSVRPGSEGQLGRRPVPGLRTAIRTAGFSRTDREARRLRRGWG